MDILGINAAFHDSAACLVRDGVVIAAVEEERLTRIKHHKRATPFMAHALPFRAIEYCLAVGKTTLDRIDQVAYSLDPFLLFDEATATPAFALPADAAAARRGGTYDPWRSIFLAGVTAAPRMLVDDVPWYLRERFGDERAAHRWAFHFVPHHRAHAASAFYPSPFERAAILTLDGQGERVSTTMWIGAGLEIEPLVEVDSEHSLGLLYERVTAHLGFMPSSDEYKVMALASYGAPRYVDGLRVLWRWCGDGRYELARHDLKALFGPPREPRSAIEQHHFDIAASLQVFLEESVLQLTGWLHERTGLENLCLAGGVALNCVMNARVLRASPFRRVWVQPAAGDAGTALGAALAVWAEQEGPTTPRWRMRDAYLGPEYTDDEIRTTLEHAKLPVRPAPDIAAEVAGLLAEGKIAAWFQGRMEFGPRALGARSILASPIDPEMLHRLNALKDREDFRPVAPAVLEEYAASYFEGCTDSPYMLFVYQVRPDKADQVPAIRHVDGTARVQTVSAERSPRYYQAIDRFRAITGIPVVVNTSFNTRSQPIVCTPQDAIECFYTSPIDALAIGSYLLTK